MSAADPDRLFASRLLRAAAMPLSAVYGAAVRMRPTPKAQRVPVPVLSVGNVHAGGTGKTPHVLAIARHLAASGRRPAVVSRGYGGSLSGVGARVTAEHRAEEVGDEPRELYRALPGIPVFIGADRVAAAVEAARESDVIVLDDGFQHRRLARDLDIVLLPASADPERQRLLPWGRLREPLDAIGRADLVVLVREPGCADHGEAWRRRLDGPVVETVREPGHVRAYPGTVEPVALLGRSVVAVSGIALPERFHAAIARAGGRVVEILAYPDHHFFREDDLKLAGRLVSRHPDALVVLTAKDEARLDGRTLPFPAAVLESALDCEALLERVDAFLRERGKPGPRAVPEPKGAV